MGKNKKRGEGEIRGDVTMKRVRREKEPEFKSCSDETLDVPWAEVENISPETQFAMSHVLYFSHATKVQTVTVPLFGKPGTSVVVEAPTGSGKTLAFLIPILERLVVQSRKTMEQPSGLPVLGRGIAGAVLSPSRVLARQTFIVLQRLACRFPFNIRVALCDSTTESAEELVQRLRKMPRGGGTILVTTPGTFESIAHLIMHGRKKANPEHEGSKAHAAAAAAAAEAEAEAEAEGEAVAMEAVNPPGTDKDPAVSFGVAGAECPFCMVVDEADAIFRNDTLRNAFQSAATALVNLMPVDFGMFGATVSSVAEVPEFVNKLRLESKAHAVGTIEKIALMDDSAYLAQLRNKCLPCDSGLFLQSLIHMLNLHPKKKHFVFFNCVEMLVFVKHALDACTEGSFPILQTKSIYTLHEGLRDITRYNEYTRFLQHDMVKNPGAILLCTDLVAHGLDARDVEYVFHYGPPNTVELYIHRIGRVARMGMTGTSLLMIPTDAPVRATMLQHAEELGREHPMEQVLVTGSALASAAPIRPRLEALVQTEKVLHAAAVKAIKAMVHNADRNAAAANDGAEGGTGGSFANEVVLDLAMATVAPSLCNFIPAKEK